MVPIGAARAGVLGGGEIPDSGVARYTFDDADTESGTAIDVWNNNDATINGATTGVTGANQTYNTNEAYSLDGSGDYIDTPISDTFSTFSFGAWGQLDATGNTTLLMATRGNGSGGQIFERGNDVWEFAVYDSDSGYFIDVRGGTPTADNWTHLIGVVDSSEIRFYVDGSSVGSTSLGTYNNGNDFDIGRDPRGGSNWNGDIDDPRIYNKALTDTEASNLYNTGSING